MSRLVEEAATRSVLLVERAAAGSMLRLKKQGTAEVMAVAAVSAKESTDARGGNLRAEEEE
jgi:hypothetical protein